VNALVSFLAEKMGIPLEGGTLPLDESPSEAGAEPPELDHLTKDELEDLLAEELSAIDDSLKGNGFGTENGTG